MKLNKKTLLHTALAILVIFSGMIATVFVLEGFEKNTHTQNTTPNTDSLEAQAQRAAQEKDNVKAQVLLQQARKIYVDNNDINGVADIDARLYLLNHPRLQIK